MTFKRNKLNGRIQLTSMLHTAPLCPLNEPNLSPFSEYHTFG